MNNWIIVSLIGIVLVLLGFIFFYKNYSLRKKLPNSTIIMGIFIPVLVALLYAESLFEVIPLITLIDLAGFFVIGMISGFHISIFLLQRHTGFYKN